MSENTLELDVHRDLMQQAYIIGKLAQDEKAFTALHQAFRSGDAGAVQQALRRDRLFIPCHLVCEWLRSVECILHCFTLCGPPQSLEHTPDLRQFAGAIARVTSDDKLFPRLIDSIETGDAAGLKKTISELKLEPFCHLFCHWVCFVRYRILCHLVCDPIGVKYPNLALELRSAGQALKHLLDHKGALEDAVAACEKSDAEKLQVVIHNAGLERFCGYICEWLCSLHCELVCIKLCGMFPVTTVTNELHEVHGLALKSQELARKPEEMEHLASAVAKQDLKTFISVVKELNLQRYCVFLCHWIYVLRCRRICVLICPPLPTGQ